MSRVVDERVVSMQFDNRQFERNIQGTLSTLDKFKQALHLDGAAKGLENVNAAAKKVDMTHLGKGLDTVRAKFSALEVMGVTVLANLTNSALNASKRIAASLTIEPIKTGFNEYELKMGSIQTIMASTGESLETVNKYLEELNKYSDQTIYSFSDMTTNIGKFTNAGVKLEDAVMAIKGISNEAAVSGANANEASRAMYNFAQALSAGYVKLIDWKSIENANMATVEFKNQLIASAVAAGTLTKAGDGLYKTLKGTTMNATKNFNDTLQEQWMTTDVLINTLRDYADENTEIGKKASQAATEVKTFTQMLDTLKESAQSGWAQTWELIFGDFLEGKALWTSISESVGGVIDAITKARNKLLEGALGRGFSDLSKKVSGLMEPLKKTSDVVEKASGALKNYDEIVNQIIKGDWGNGQARWDKLTEAGYDWAHAQNLVNEKLGDGTRYATKYSKSQDKVADSQGESAKSQGEVTEAGAKRLEQLTELSEAELKSLGYTDEQIDALRELKKEADKLGISVSEFVLRIDELDGRTILLESFANIGQSIATVFKSIKDAFVEIFPPMTAEQLYNIIAGFHKLTEHLVVSDETADKMKRTFAGLFAALDIVLTIVGGPIKIAFKLLTKILEAFDLNIWDVTAAIGDAIVKFRDWIDSILDFSGIFDKMLPSISKFIDSIKNWFAGLKDQFVPVGQNIIEGIKNGLSSSLSTIWDAMVNIGKTIIEAVKNVLGIHSPSTVMKEQGKYAIEGFVNGLTEGAKEALNAIAEIFRAIAAFFPQLKIFNALAYLVPVIIRFGSDTASGFVQGLVEGSKQIFSKIAEIFKAVIEKVKNILGIHSPSRVFMTIGAFLISGLILGIVESKTGALSAIKDFCGEFLSKCKVGFGKVVDWLKNIDWPEFKMEYILGIGALVGLVMGVKKLLDITQSFAKGVESFGAGVKGIGNFLDGLANGFEKKKGKFESIANNVLKLSIAIGILAASAYVLAQLDYGKLWSAVGAIVVLAGVVIALGAIINKIDVDGKEFGKFSLMLLSISASLWIMASALKKLEFINETNGNVIFGSLAALIIGLVTVIAAFGQLVKGKTAQNIDKAGILIMKIGLAMLTLVTVAKICAGMTDDELKRGGAAILALGVIVAGLIWATKLAGKKIDAAGGMILKVALAIGLLAITAKLCAGMEPGELITGGAAVLAFGAIIAGLIWATKISGGKKRVQELGGVIMAAGASILLIALAAKLCSKMSPGELIKGGIAVAVFGGIIAGLIYITKFATDKQMKGVAATLLAASLAIGVMAATAVILGMISEEGLVRGTAAVAVLGILMVTILHASQYAEKANKSIVAMAIAIGVMAAAVTVLSFIDPTKLAGATAAMAVLMGMFALMAKAAGSAQKAMGTIIILGLVIAEMAFILYKLSELPTESVLGSALSLSAVMLAVTGLLKILEYIKPGKALGGVLALTAMVVPLAAFGIAFALIPDMSNKLNTIYILTGVMTAMTGLLAVLSLIGVLITATGGGALLGVVGLTAMVVPLAAFAIAFAALPDMTQFVGTINILMRVMRELTGMLTILAIIGPMALIGVGALAALESLIVATGVFAVAVGALMEKFPALESFLNTGLGVLKNIARGLGEMVSEFAAGLTSGLPEIGSNLSGFMTNLQGFLDGIKMVDDGIVKKVGSLSAAILLLTAADLINGLSTFLTNGGGFASLGADLSAFMINAMPFITGVAMVDPASMEGVKALAEAILVLTAADLISGLTSWFGGGVNLADFGAQLAAFAPHMKTYAETVAGIDGEAVKASAEAAKCLADMAANLPNSGGWLGAICGENDMATFGADLVSFGKALKDYSVAVTGIAIEPINASVEAAKKLSEMAENIPNLGGVVSWFTGDNDLVTFGSQIVAFGTALKLYSITVTGILMEPIMNSVEAGKALAGLSEAIPNLGGMVTWFTGDNDFVTFGSQIVAFGSALKMYAMQVADLNVGAIALSVTAAQQLSALAKALPSDGGFWSLFKDDTMDFKAFGEEIKELGSGMSGYSKSVSKLNAGAVSSSISSARALVSLIKNMAGLDSSGVETFSKAMATLGKTSVDKFVKAFTSSTSKLTNIGSNMIKAVATGVKSSSNNFTNSFNQVLTSVLKSLTSKQETFRNAGVNLITKFVSGINAHKAKTNTAMSTMLSGVVTKIRSYYSKFYNAGTYVVSGFAKGISANSYKAEAKAAAMARAAYLAAMEAIGAASPAKKFIDVGMFADQGLAKGLSAYAYLATRASAGLGKDVVTAIEDELKINSPSKVTKEDGKYIVQGIAEGIKKDTSAEEAVEQKAKNITEAFKNEMSKYDNSMKTSDLEYELWEVHNESATIAEKTAQKAANIYKRVTAQTEKVALAQAEYTTMFDNFGAESKNTQEAYNKFLEEQITLNSETKALLELRNDSINEATNAAQTRMTTADLEYEKWELDNTNASEAEKAAKSLEITLEKIEEQAGNVGRAQALWEIAKKRYGEESTEATEAYNDYLESQIDLTTMTNEVEAKFQEATQTNRDAMVAYYDRLKEDKDRLLEMGLTEDVIKQAIRTETGYDPDKQLGLNKIDISNVTTKAKSIVDQVFAECMNSGINTAVTEQAQRFGENIAAGLTDAAPGVQTAVQSISDACESVMVITKVDWVELGKQFVESFAEGITNNAKAASEAVTNIIASAYQAAIDYIEEHSEDVGMSMGITPVIDMSNIQNGLGQLNGLFATNTAALADINVRLTNDSISELSAVLDKARMNDDAKHSELISAIKTLRGDFGNLVEAIGGMSIQMDSGAMVGELINKIDSGLGQIASYKGRGN